MRTIPVQIAASVFAASLLLVPLAGCVSGLIYQGDGKLTDRGVFAYETAEGRYTLRIETISFAETGEYKYKMANFPGDDFVVGFQINKPIEIVDKARTGIRVRLVNEKNEQVIDVQAELKDWTLSYPIPDKYPVYAYMREEGPVESRNGNSGQKTAYAINGADCGRGTYFRPRKWTEYTLFVSVEAAEDAPVAKAEVVLKDTVPSENCN